MRIIKICQIYSFSANLSISYGESLSSQNHFISRNFLYNNIYGNFLSKKLNIKRLNIFEIFAEQYVENLSSAEHYLATTALQRVTLFGLACLQVYTFDHRSFYNLFPLLGFLVLFPIWGISSFLFGNLQD